MNSLAPIHEARLPETYEAARTALSQCSSVDECQSWADKAAALASYARQAKDDQLEKMAQRIRARAIRRAGELLKQIEPGQGARDGKRVDGAVSPLTRTEAARDAGMSERQQMTAVRVASVPAADFEAQIDSANPPTLSQLASQGIQKRPEPQEWLQGRSPKAFNAALHFTALVIDYAAELADAATAEICAHLDDGQKAKLRAAIGRIDAIHDRIITRI